MLISYATRKKRNVVQKDTDDEGRRLAAETSPHGNVYIVWTGES